MTPRAATDVGTGRIPFPRVAVIGGGGYVGSALVPVLLTAGYTVTVVDRFFFGEEVFNGLRTHPALRIVKLDIRDEPRLAEALRGAEAVIHLACISNDPSFELDPRLGRSINYEAFFGLLRAVRANRVQRFLYASSSSVYGVNPQPEITEETPCNPLTEYSAYKLRCEEALKAEGIGPGDWVILRPATVCGYALRLRLDLTVNILAIQALVKRQITVFGGSQLRPNLNIRDMAAAYQRILEAPRDQVHAQTFNVGCQNRSVAELAELVRRCVGDPAVTIEVQPTTDLRSYHINADRIRGQVGFAPRWTIEEAVESLCAAYRAGRIPDPLTNPRYSNIKTMQAWQGGREAARA